MQTLSRLQNLVSRPPIAVGVLSVAMALIALNDAIIKLMSERMPLFEIMVLRAIPAILILFLLPGLVRSLRALPRKTVLLLIFRGSLLTCGMLLFFLGVSELPLGEVTALFFTAPLLISLFSVPVLGERLGPWRLAALVIGMVGVIFIAQPEVLFSSDLEAGVDQGGTGWAFLFPLAAAAFYASFQLLTRWLRATASVGTMAAFQQVVYFSVGIVGSLFVLLVSPSVPNSASGQFLLGAWSTPLPLDYLLFFLCALITLFLSLASANAYRSAEAAFVAPFEYAALPSAVLWGGIIWGVWPDLFSGIGIALILGAGLLVVLRERRKDVETATATPMPATAAATQDRWGDEN